MPVVLIFKTGDETIEFPLLGKTTVGRSSSCDLTIADKQMSGKHGSFEITPKGEVVFSDLGSTNGSFINNSQVLKTIFKINDIIKLGKTSVEIDEKKLTSKERLAIGKSVSADQSGLSVVPLKVDPSINQETTKEKKTVVLNKELKNKLTKAPSGWAGNKNELVIEQEESTGKTKMLKLDIGQGLGKKKK